jgi:hypothetical protein
MAAMLWAAATASAVAGPNPAPLPQTPPVLLSQTGRMTLEQAVDRVQQSTGGRVLDARDAGGVYRIKVLTPRGEVRIVLVDPRSGAMR